MASIGPLKRDISLRVVVRVQIRGGNKWILTSSLTLCVFCVLCVLCVCVL